MKNSINKNPSQTTGQWLTVQDMKEQAGSLRKYLEEEGVKLSHSKGLEAVARSNGFKDWNTAAAVVHKSDEFLSENSEPSASTGNESIYVSEEQIAYIGWQRLGRTIRISGNSVGVLGIRPEVSPYFDPKAVRLYGVDAAKPSINRRFMVTAVEVGRTPQECVHRPRLASSEHGILSDVFNRSKDPLLVNWSVFSTMGLARELEIHVFNMNERDILVSSCIWGNSVSSLDAYE